MLDNKLAEHTVIVGASSPIAIAAVKQFLERGDEVTMVSRSRPALSAEWEDNVNLKFYSFDLENIAGISALYEEIKENCQIEVTRLCFFQRFRGNGDDWMGEINVSILATERLIEEFVKHASTIDVDRSVVIVSSPADSEVVLEQPLSYHVGKAGLSQMVRYFACKLGKNRIRVNAIKPALVFKERAREFYEKNTDLVHLFNEAIPLGRMGTPDDIANATVFFCSNLSSYITGQLVSIDGGISVHENASLARLSASLFNEDLRDERWKKS